MTDSSPILTYILRNGNSFYCGKTNNLERRMKEHAKDRYKHHYVIWTVNGDHENKIKSFGVKRFYNVVQKGLLS